MRDELYVFANEVERLLQFIDARQTGNPSEARFIIKKLREKIAATRENPNKQSSLHDPYCIHGVYSGNSEQCPKCLESLDSTQNRVHQDYCGLDTDHKGKCVATFTRDIATKP